MRFYMLLLIDIGNTNTKFGAFRDGSIKDIRQLMTGRREVDEYSSLFESFAKNGQIKKLRGVSLCSVVPDVTPILMKAVKKSFGIQPLAVTHETRTGLKFPSGIGADRVAQVIAARELYKGNLIVIAFGTATVFNVITEDGKYLGGAIMPGIDLSLEALGGGTAKLPRVVLKTPRKLLSKETENNILTGVILGHAGAVERIVSEIKKDTGMNFKVIVTGGFARFVKPHLKINNFENRHLTFEGLRLIFEMNEDRKT
jgi:type III pantothenate kinase